ncbi:MAG: nickel pincer cofactor biosynthesis protein LarB [Pseudomonadota bacterium]|nr:nickel pincer cofactor biosynthesis protein LarB [Pseudomonadota bacterium]
MDEKYLRQLLERYQQGSLDTDQVLDTLKDLPYRDVGVAHLDTHRSLRDKIGEVVFAEGKTIEQLITIVRHMLELPGNILITRLSAMKADLLLKHFPQSEYDKEGECLTIKRHQIEPSGRGAVLIVTAGTSDLRVAREAAITLEFMGQTPELLVDVGVAGLHRLLAYRGKLDAAAVIIVIAGMEGALPSVVAGLVDKPVIALPTSVGYGAAFGGISALLGMLNSCAGGIGVVNIDNGYGAAYLAGLINWQL